MKPELKERMIVEALRATELMTAIAALAATVLQNLGMLSFFGLVFCANGVALKRLSFTYPESTKQSRTIAIFRKITVRTAVIIIVALNATALVAPAFRPLEYIKDYISYGPSPGAGWVLAYKSTHYRCYIQESSIKRNGNKVDFVFRISIRKDIRPGGIAYFITHASGNCLTHSSISAGRVSAFASTGKGMATFTPASAVALTNSQSPLSVVLDNVCVRSSNS